ncbi:MAG TPA: hypothetical protein DHW82_10705, partial [Spirochaetia bacterium]|nr:hypothetical protein [Spirochaetia bacterium]
MKILVVDDEKNCADVLYDFLVESPHQIKKTYSGKSALALLSQEKTDLLISDVNMPGMNGFELLKEIRKNNKTMEVILISGKEDIVRSINAIELGIFDFLEKPIDVSKLYQMIQNIENDRMIKNRIKKEKKEKSSVFLLKNFQFNQSDSFNDPKVGKVGVFSKKMVQIFQKLEKLQKFPDIPVLIEGKTGTGKEIIAKYLHYKNYSGKGEFLGVNCSALNENLFEAELFGYEKGAFTGADPKGSPGKIALAANGTLFFDEISELPLNLQVKLLRVIQEKEYFRVGGKHAVPLNARLIFASNRNLSKMCEKGLFRQDLFYRINVCKILIPDLKQRKSEIIPLFLFFLNQINEEVGTKIEGVERQALEFLKEHEWQGNIRELKNIATKAGVFSESKILTLKEIKNFIKPIQMKKKIFIHDFELPESSLDLDLLIKTIIQKTLE